MDPPDCAARNKADCPDDTDHDADDCPDGDTCNLPVVFLGRRDSRLLGGLCLLVIIMIIMVMTITWIEQLLRILM